MGRRAAEHVEADTAGGALVPRRQPASVAPLFAISFAPTQGPHGRNSDPGIWPSESASSWLIGLVRFRAERTIISSGVMSPLGFGERAFGWLGLEFGGSVSYR